MEILRDLKTDWVCLGFRYRFPIPYSPSEEPDFFNEVEIREARLYLLTIEGINRKTSSRDAKYITSQVDWG